MSIPPQRLDLDYRIEWKGTWHVGSGYSTVQADRLICRRGGRDGRPFVPGSQVKGVLRHQAERLAWSLGRKVVPPHAIGRDQQEQLVGHFRPLDRSPLIIDRLFGSRHQGECLFVDDALPSSGLPRSSSDHDHRLLIRTAMDRLTGTVKEGHLFVTEVAEKDAVRLSGQIRARHPGGTLLTVDGFPSKYPGFPLEYALLVASLGTIDGLGGDKAVGQGRCRIIPESPIRWHAGQGEKNLLAEDVLVMFADGEWEMYVELAEEMRPTS